MIIVVALIIDLLFLPAFLLQFDRSKKNASVSTTSGEKHHG